MDYGLRYRLDINVRLADYDVMTTCYFRSYHILHLSLIFTSRCVESLTI